MFDTPDIVLVALFCPNSLDPLSHGVLETPEGLVGYLTPGWWQQILS